MTKSIALYFFQLTSSGGAERMICQLANALVKQGFNVHLISLDDTKATSYYPIHNEVKWHKIGKTSGLSGKFQRIKILKRLIKKEQIKALIGFVMSGDKTIYAAAKLSRIKLIAAERNAPTMYKIRYSRLQRNVMLKMLNLTDEIIVQQPNFKYGYPKSLQKKITAISNPVPLAESLADPEEPNSNGRFTLLAVSRLDQDQKGLETLVHAFAKIANNHPVWDLRIIGDGPERDVLLNLISLYDLTSQITIEASKKTIFEAYQDANLFVIPSLWEGFPNALAEAMSHGLPAVGFEKASGVSELLQIGGGWVAPGLQDVDALASTLSKAMKNSAERKKRGAFACETMKEFEPEKQFQRWGKIISETMDK